MGSVEHLLASFDAGSLIRDLRGVHELIHLARSGAETWSPHIFSTLNDLDVRHRKRCCVPGICHGTEHQWLVVVLQLLGLEHLVVGNDSRAIKHEHVVLIHLHLVLSHKALHLCRVPCRSHDRLSNHGALGRCQCLHLSQGQGHWIRLEVPNGVVL